MEQQKSSSSGLSPWLIATDKTEDDLPILFYINAHRARQAQDVKELRRWIDWAAARLGGHVRLERMRTMKRLLKVLYRLEYSAIFERNSEYR